VHYFIEENLVISNGKRFIKSDAKFFVHAKRHTTDWTTGIHRNYTEQTEILLL